MPNRTQKGLKRKQKKGVLEESRLAFILPKRCKPKKCNHQCKKTCPVVRQGKKECCKVKKSSKMAYISETLCIGCGICVNKCPFQAIQIVNLPKNLESQTTHRYGPNGFKLHRLPTPRPGQVLGLVGTNGIGKTTALKILAASLCPNLGDFVQAPDWQNIIKYFRGNELQRYFQLLVENELKCVLKPQYVDQIPKHAGPKATVKDKLLKKGGSVDRDRLKYLIQELELSKLKDRKLVELSGGELQRFALAMVCSQKANVFMFDEPSSYLDVKQRLTAAHMIRGLLSTEYARGGKKDQAAMINDRYVVVVEHDLSILDYLSDFVCCLYGQPGAYGVVTLPASVREGINIFLDGEIPTENMRFRPEALHFRQTTVFEEDVRARNYKYPEMKKTLGGSFRLKVRAGSFSDSQITVMLGENGTGKTTLIKMLAGAKGYEPDEGDVKLPELKISYKPQKIAPAFKGTVQQLLQRKLGALMFDANFKATVMKPMKMAVLMPRYVVKLSGGELQRLAIVLCLGKPANVYLIDEPSAYLDSEQRVIAGKVIKKFIMQQKKTAFIVEHDFIMATYLADQVIVYEGTPAKKCIANPPEPLVSGMNKFLKSLNITFRRDPRNFRPRINKLYSIKDMEQKKTGNYFYMNPSSELREPEEEDQPKKKKNPKAKKNEKN